MIVPYIVDDSASISWKHETTVNDEALVDGADFNYDPRTTSHLLVIPIKCANSSRVCRQICPVLKSGAVQMLKRLRIPRKKVQKPVGVI